MPPRAPARAGDRAGGDPRDRDAPGMRAERACRNAARRGRRRVGGRVFGAPRTPRPPAPALEGVDGRRSPHPPRGAAARRRSRAALQLIGDRAARRTARSNCSRPRGLGARGCPPAPRSSAVTAASRTRLGPGDERQRPRLPSYFSGCLCSSSNFASASDGKPRATRVYRATRAVACDGSDKGPISSALFGRDDDSCAADPVTHSGGVRGARCRS